MVLRSIDAGFLANEGASIPLPRLSNVRRAEVTVLQDRIIYRAARGRWNDVDFVLNFGSEWVPNAQRLKHHPLKEGVELPVSTIVGYDSRLKKLCLQGGVGNRRRNTAISPFLANYTMVKSGDAALVLEHRIENIESLGDAVHALGLTVDDLRKQMREQNEKLAALIKLWS